MLRRLRMPVDLGEETALSGSNLEKSEIGMSTIPKI